MDFVKAVEIKELVNLGLEANRLVKDIKDGRLSIYVGDLDIPDYYLGKVLPNINEDLKAFVLEKLERKLKGIEAEIEAL